MEDDRGVDADMLRVLLTAACLELLYDRHGAPAFGLNRHTQVFKTYFCPETNSRRCIDCDLPWGPAGDAVDGS